MEGLFFFKVVLGFDQHAPLAREDRPRCHQDSQRRRTDFVQERVKPRYKRLLGVLFAVAMEASRPYLGDIRFRPGIESVTVLSVR